MRQNEAMGTAPRGEGEAAPGRDEQPAPVGQTHNLWVMSACTMGRNHPGHSPALLLLWDVQHWGALSSSCSTLVSVGMQKVLVSCVLVTAWGLVWLCFAKQKPVL